jgi:hypothetical protein
MGESLQRISHSSTSGALCVLRKLSTMYQSRRRMCSRRVVASCLLVVGCSPAGVRSDVVVGVAGFVARALMVEALPM